MFIILLGRHVSVLIESSSGPSKKIGKGKAVPLQAWTGPEGS